MTDIVVIGIVVLIIGGAIGYIVHAKKNGAVCIGCSASNCSCSCNSSSTGTCGCATGEGCTCEEHK